MSVTEQIHTRLTEVFAPRVLEVVDQSEQHRGHAGYREGGESHFQVHIVADAFKGKNRIARHRAVHAALGADLVGRIHALSLQIEG